MNTEPLGPNPLNLWLKRRRDDVRMERLKAKIALEVGVDVPIRGGATAGGDTRRLRGIPAIGRGVGGCINGSDPLRALMRREM